MSLRNTSSTFFATNSNKNLTNMSSSNTSFVSSSNEILISYLMRVSVLSPYFLEDQTLTYSYTVEVPALSLHVVAI